MEVNDLVMQSKGHATPGPIQQGTQQLTQQLTHSATSKAVSGITLQQEK
jgi:hypothetical protein